MKITLTSFGYKHGDLKADVTMSVKSLPNPYSVPELHNLKGTDAKVQEFVLGTDKGANFISKAHRYITKQYKEEISVGIGCVGGQHRSVAIVEELARKFSEAGHEVTFAHRDLKDG